MKKIYIIIVSFIVFILGLIILCSRKNSIYTVIDGVKYAIEVNGESANAFPNGNYKVDVDCDNADGCWNSVNNKLIVKNITGNISCNIEFNSISAADYLNNYLTGLADISQGLGKLVLDTANVLDYSSTNIVTAYNTTPVYFANNSNSALTQTQVDDYWTFNSSTGTFTSDPSVISTTSSTVYYHVYAQLPSGGYYQICYTINQESTSRNRLSITIDNNSSTAVKTIKSSSSGQVGGCYHLGYLNANYINIAEISSNNDTRPVISFRIEKITANQDYIGYRFQGKKPNNYIMFNDELWRIIGVIPTEYDSNNDGTADKTDNLVKIIRADSIGEYSWDKSNTNDWPDSTLYHLLNEQYYDWETNNTNSNNYCYGYNSALPSKCNFTNNGIKDGYRNMIVKAKWYLGGGGKKNGYAIMDYNRLYIYERDSDAVYSGNAFDTLGYIGIIYPSDYVHGSLVGSCYREAYLSEECIENNWLRGLSNTSTISHNSESSNVIWSIDSYSEFRSTTSSYASSPQTTYPTLYLSPDVYRVSGTGTITDPYIIGMAS